MNTKQPHDDIDAFEKKLQYEASRPDDEFRSHLKRTMLKSYRSTSDSLFTKLCKGVQKVDIKTVLGKWPKQNRYAAAGVFLLLIVSVSSVAGYTVYRGRNYTKAVTGSDKQELLSKFALLQGTRNSLGTDGSAKLESAAAFDLSMPAPAWLDRDYTYAKRISITSNGPAAGQCPAMASNIEGKGESYNYNDENASYSKYIQYDTAGQLLDYYLYTPEYRIEYKGGDFAIKTLEDNNRAVLYDETTSLERDTASSPQSEQVEDGGTSAVDTPEGEDPANTSGGNAVNVEIVGDEQPMEVPTVEDPISGDIIEPIDTSEPGDDTEPSADQIDSMFGPDAQVEEVVKGGKVVEYIVIWSYPASCDAQVYMLSEPSSIVIRSEGSEQADDTASVTLVQKTWYDAESMDITRDESYLGSVSPDNLIQAVVTEADTRDAAFDEVRSDFEFEFQVEVKVIDPSDYAFEPYSSEQDRAAYSNAALDELQAKNIMILDLADAWLVSTGFSVSSLDLIEDPYEQYYLDRKYYPVGADGDDKHAQAQKMYEQSDDYLMPAVEQSFGNPSPDKYQGMTVDIFAADVTVDEILDDYLGVRRDDTVQEQTSVKVDGTELPATRYIQKVEYGVVGLDAVGSDGEAAILPEQEVLQTEETVYYLFSFAGQNYSIYYYAEADETGIPSFAFGSYDPNSAEGEDRIRQMIEDSFSSAPQESVEDTIKIMAPEEVVE